MTTKNILRFLLLIITFLSSGCGKSPINDSPTSTPIPSPISTSTMIAPTSTPIPCVSSPQTPTSDIEKEAEEWFLSSKQIVANRDEYIPYTKWENFCLKYQNAIMNKEYWTSAPIEIALNVTGFPYEQGPFPTSIYAISSKFHNVMTITILDADLDDDSIEAIESRLDLIKIDQAWQLYWLGHRQRCWRPYDQPHDWTKEPCP